MNEELCNRVLTTSSGQVTTAPAVPATLEFQRKILIISFEFQGFFLKFFFWSFGISRIV